MQGLPLGNMLVLRRGRVLARGEDRGMSEAREETKTAAASVAVGLSGMVALLEDTEAPEEVWLGTICQSMDKLRAIIRDSQYTEPQARGFAKQLVEWVNE